MPAISGLRIVLTSKGQYDAGRCRVQSKLERLDVDDLAAEGLEHLLDCGILGCGLSRLLPGTSLVLFRRQRSVGHLAVTHDESDADRTPANLRASFAQNLDVIGFGYRVARMPGFGREFNRQFVTFKIDSRSRADRGGKQFPF